VDFEAWLRTQTTEVQKAYAEHTNGLKSALREERLHRRSVEEVLESVENARKLTEVDFSADNKRDLLSKAIQRRSPDLHFWVRDIFDEYVIYQASNTSKLYRVNYSLDDKGKVTELSDPVEVVVSTTYTPVEEASQDIATDFIPLVEGAVRKDGTAKIKLIDEGWGSSGYYAKDVLARDIPKVFPKGTKMYLDHPTPSEEAERPERTVRDVAAVLESDPIWLDKGPAGPGVYAEMKVMKGYQEMVSELAPHIGLSIRAGGMVETGKAAGREGRIVKAIEVGKSVDFVTDPGRGGKILDLYESMRKPKPEPLSETHTQPAAEATKPKENEMAELYELREANKTLTEKAEQTDAELKRLREANVLRDARDRATKVMRKYDGLPVITAERLIESLAKKAPVKDGTLDVVAFDALIETEVKAEAAYLQKMGVSGNIRGLGGTAEGQTDVDEKKAAEEVDQTLEESFSALGLNEASRKHAVDGRR
jgi:hypothetical protein